MPEWWVIDFCIFFKYWNLVTLSEIVRLSPFCGTSYSTTFVVLSSQNFKPLSAILNEAWVLLAGF